MISTTRNSRLKEDSYGTVSAALVDVALHLEVAVLGAEVDVGGEHHLDVLLPLGQRLGATSFGRHGGRLGFRTRAPCARERRGREAGVVAAREVAKGWGQD